MQTNTRLHTATHRTTIFSGISWPGLRAETGRDDISFRQPACNVYSHKLRVFVWSRHFLLCFPGFYFVLRILLSLVSPGPAVYFFEKKGKQKNERNCVLARGGVRARGRDVGCRGKGTRLEPPVLPCSFSQALYLPLRIESHCSKCPCKAGGPAHCISII